MIQKYSLQESSIKNRIKDETFVYNSWEKQQGNQFVFESKNIKILSTGMRNLVSGPDYKNAVILLDNDVIRGDVEIHNTCEEWYTHQHHLDPFYTNVVLHVFSSGDYVPILNNNHKRIPTIQLTSSFSQDSNSCTNIVNSLSESQIIECVRIYSNVKYETTCEQFKTNSQKYVIEKLFHFLDVHGNKITKQTLVYYFIENYKDTHIEQMILSLKNMLHASSWEYGSRYPKANPQNRLALLVYLGYILFDKNLDINHIDVFKMQKIVKQKGYNVPGNHFLIELLGNIFIPLKQNNTNSSLFDEWYHLNCQPYGKCKRLLSKWNLKTKISFGLQQGLLLIMKELCASNSCQHCPLYHIN